MRKISLSIVCSASVCSSVALANNPAGNAADLKKTKPFVGLMVGTLISFQTGLWGGLEFNFMDI